MSGGRAGEMLVRRSGDALSSANAYQGGAGESQSTGGIGSSRQYLPGNEGSPSAKLGVMIGELRAEHSQSTTVHLHSTATQ